MSFNLTHILSSIHNVRVNNWAGYAEWPEFDHRKSFTINSLYVQELRPTSKSERVWRGYNGEWQIAFIWKFSCVKDVGVSMDWNFLTGRAQLTCTHQTSVDRLRHCSRATKTAIKNKWLVVQIFISSFEFLLPPFQIESAGKYPFFTESYECNNLSNLTSYQFPFILKRAKSNRK